MNQNVVQTRVIVIIKATLLLDHYNFIRSIIIIINSIYLTIAVNTCFKAKKDAAILCSGADHGTCTDDGNGRWTCTCEAGYIGVNCETCKYKLNNITCTCTCI